MIELPFAGLLRPVDPRHGSAYLPVVRHGSLRSLLPVEPAPVLRAALHRSNGPETLARHLARRAYAGFAGLRLGHGPGARTSLIGLDDRELRELLGGVVDRPVRLAIHFGPPRANRKPVVHVLDEEGRLRAVAKVGVDERTESLVVVEAEALRALAQPGLAGALVVPRLLALTSWAGRPLLVQSAVPVGGRHTCPGPERRSGAERALVGALPPRPGGAEAYLAGLHARVTELTDVAARDQLLRALDLAADRIDVGLVRTGAWHGDWSPQNVAASPQGAVAWDWERLATDRPLGFDAAHFQLQWLLGRRRARPGERLVDRAPGVFRCWQPLPDPVQARALALLLLVELGARYVGDGQPDTEAPGAAVLSWLPPALDRLHHPTPRPEEAPR